MAARRVTTLFRPSMCIERCSSFKSEHMAAAVKYKLYEPDPAKRRKGIVFTKTIEKTSADKEFMKLQLNEFEIGRRHLANMMGEDVETFTQQDIDNAIRYLFPTNIYEKRARPQMKHPDDLFPKQKAEQWGTDGRPYNYLFYTRQPQYFSLMHDTVSKLKEVIKKETEMLMSGVTVPDVEPINLTRSVWIKKSNLEAKLIEEISDRDYDDFLALMERLINQRYVSLVKGHVLEYREELFAETMKVEIEPLQYDDNGRGFSTGEGMRKTAHATVVVYDQGRGNITVNGQRLSEYFYTIPPREMIMFPLQFVDMLGEVDIDCTVTGGGLTSQAGAIRLAVAQGLKSFTSEELVDRMRLAGLLTKDLRLHERKKPGQKGARAKYTWKKR